MNGAAAASTSRLLPSGLTLSSAMRSRLKNREISMRKQVGDTQSMFDQDSVTVKKFGKGAVVERDDEEVA